MVEQKAARARTGNILEMRRKQDVVRCPVCRGEHVYRAERRGLVKMSVLPIFGFYPWHCKGCGAEVMLRRRGGQHRKRIAV